MKNREVEFGSKLVLVATIFMIIASIFYLFVPYEQKLILFGEQYFESFNQNSIPYFGFWIGMSLMGLCMIGVIINFQFYSEKLKTPVFKWVSTLAIFGYALMVLTYISRLYYMPGVTQAYLESSNANVKETIVALGTMEFDKFILSYGLASVWFLTVGIISVKNKLFSKLFRILCFITSMGYTFGLLGYLIETRILTTLASLMVVLFPFWSINLYLNTQKKRRNKNEYDRN